MDDLQTTERTLSSFTPARTGLVRAGSAIATGEQLRFQLDHALARDAVHHTVDFTSLLSGLRGRKLAPIMLESAVSPAAGRHEYLKRPDLGRRLAPRSADELSSSIAEACPAPDVAILIVDGLSALAIDRHALPLLDALLPLLGSSTIAPVCVVHNGRVAIGDEIGAILRARLTVLLIGERPGLSAPDSLGVYLTWEPRPGRTDAERNCISNIRLGALDYEDAARRIASYMNAARELGGTGYRLKEPASPNLLR